MTTAALLGLFALALAYPVPHALAAAHWPTRCPRAGIVLWQAIGLAGGMSALLSVLAFGVAPLSPHLVGGLVDHADHVASGRPLDGLGIVNLLGLGAAAALAARLLGVLFVSTARTVRERRRHRHLVDLAGHMAGRSGHVGHGRQSGVAAGERPACGLCDHSERGHARLRILDHPVAVAYCVPGVRRPRVVVSAGLLTTLAPDELDAVLAHEEAHANGRHDLVIQPFVAWQATFPFLRPAREATAAVSLLIEMLADDVAARSTSGRTLARALARLGVTRVPLGALGITGAWPVRGTLPRGAAPAIQAPVISRISRLLEPRTAPLWLPAAAYLAAAAVVTLPVGILLNA